MKAEAPWSNPPRRPPPELFDALPDLPPLLVHLAVQRLGGPADPAAMVAWPAAADVRAFLEAERATVSAPAIPRLAEAAGRLVLAVRRGERVGIHGDYDADGVTSAALLEHWLRGVGADVQTILPHRQRDGYGLGPGAIERFAADGCRLVVAVDCGITAHAAATVARQRGIDLIVLDHHQPDAEVPAALVVNPHLGDGDEAHRCLAAVGLAYRLVEAATSAGVGDAACLEGLLDLVAIGTIADACPLVGQNRSLVARGLRVLRRGGRSGLAALARGAGLDVEQMDEEDVAYRLAPRLNAAGRIDGAEPAFRLLLAAEGEAPALAEELERRNRRRQQLTDEAVAAALAQLGPVNGRARVLVAWDATWHPGVMGLVAARLAEHFDRPAVALTGGADGYVGSARSVGGVDILGALRACGDLVSGCGGHAGAAGLRVEASALEGLRRRLSEVVGDDGDGEAAIRPLRPEASVRLETLTPALVRSLRALGPFGQGNPPPLLLGSRLRVVQVALVGKGGAHARIRLRDAAVECGGIMFGAAVETLPRPGSLVGALFVPRLDTFRGVERVDLHVAALRPAQ